MEIRKGKALHESGTKKLYPTNNPELYILHFKDDIILSHKKGKSSIKHKGEINNGISAFLFQYLESYHVATHFVKVFKPDDMLVKSSEMIPIEAVIWNIATKDFNRRFGVPKGEPLACPIVEYYYKDKNHKQPMINLDHACAFGLGTAVELQDMDNTVRKVNTVLKSYFDRRDLQLVYFKLEFGRTEDQIIVADEISLDTCHFFDMQSEDVKSQPLLPDEAPDIKVFYDQMKERFT